MRVLIIEDDRAIAELEKDYLEMSGYQCEIAASGNLGLKKSLEGGYDLIILDLMLPEIDGLEILKKIRESTEIPVIIISAKGEDIDKVRGLGLGADDYMVKPFSPSELVARVKARVSRYQKLIAVDNFSNENSTINFGDLAIDKGSRRVFVSGEERTLANKEFDLLLFLAENPNRVFSKDLLFDRIWGLDALGDISTVTVHIRRIREKIESEPQKYIETVWGVGYRFSG